MTTDLSCCGFSRNPTTHMVSSLPLHCQHTVSQVSVPGIATKTIYMKKNMHTLVQNWCK